jgi:hypothetical protein
MLDLSAVITIQSSFVSMVTPESCAASTSQLDDVVYEHVTTTVDYEHCNNHYSSLPNTEHLQYDSLQLTTSSTTCNKNMKPFNKCEVTDDDNQSIGNVTSEQNGQSITSQCHAESAPATVEDYLAVLADHTSSPVNALLSCCGNVG